MSNKENNKNPLIGSLEIGLLMKTGFNHFDQDVSKMLRSFAVIIPSFILMILTLPYLQESKASWAGDATIGLISILFSLKFLFGLVASIGLTYYFCKVINRLHNFVRFITVVNWFSIITLLLFIPLFVMLQQGINNYDGLHPIFVVISVYSYIVLGFISRHIIDIPWELAVFFTVCFIAINEFAFSMLSLILN